MKKLMYDDNQFIELMDIIKTFFLYNFEEESLSNELVKQLLDAGYSENDVERLFKAYKSA